LLLQKQSGVNFINIFAQLFHSKKFDAFFGKRRTDLAKFRSFLGHKFGKCGCKSIGEIGRQIFRQMLCAGNFSLSEKSLMKSTPEVFSQVSFL
jgi:hypothetical protein